MKQALYFNGLNGLRAIAALSVLFSHTTMALQSFGLNSYVFGKYPDGNPKTTLLAGFGVSIFFVLSGFLITYLLLEERSTGDINIRNFYLRRILRIWPLYYLYFSLCILTLIVFDLPFDKLSTLFYIFLVANIPFIFGGTITFLAHYWSLGVEEQFYSFWPWIVKRSQNIKKTTVIVCVLLVLLKCIFKCIEIGLYNGESIWPYSALHVTRFHCMLLGAIGAILYFERNSLFLRLTNNFVTQSLCWIVIFLVAINKFHIMSFLDNEIIATVTVFLIVGQILKNKRIINLDFSFFNFIGKISYGIYVIHPLVIFYLSKVIVLSDQSSLFNYLLIYISVFLATIILAYLSYEFFERRFLLLKEKYTSVRSLPV